MFRRPRSTGTKKRVKAYLAVTQSSYQAVRHKLNVLRHHGRVHTDQAAWEGLTTTGMTTARQRRRAADESRREC